MLSSDFLFPRLFVVPLVNPSNFSHCKCFSSQIPFLFQYSLRIMTCTSGTLRGSTEVQEEKTRLIRYFSNISGLIIIVMSNIARYVKSANQY